jgi:hypothetical protein
VTAAASLAQLKPREIDDFHTCLAHLRNDMGIALIGDDHAGFQSHGIVRIVPLLALCLILITTGLNNVQLFDLQCISDCGNETLFLGDMEVTWFLARPQVTVRMLFTTWGKAVATSRSNSVKTVSRCMWTRSLVMTEPATGAPDCKPLI